MARLSFAHEPRNMAAFLEENHRLRSRREDLQEQQADLKAKLAEVEGNLETLIAQIAEQEEQLSADFAAPAQSRAASPRVNVNAHRIVSPEARSITRGERLASRKIELLRRVDRWSADASVTKRKRSARDTGDDDDGYEGQAAHSPAKQASKRRPTIGVFSPHLPIIVDLDDVWTEVWCHICGANATPITGEFFSGTRGLTYHYTHKHKREVEGECCWKNLVEVCGKQALSEEDIKGYADGSKEVVARFGGEEEEKEEEDQAAEGTQANPVVVDENEQFEGRQNDAEEIEQERQEQAEDEEQGYEQSIVTSASEDEDALQHYRQHGLRKGGKKPMVQEQDDTDSEDEVPKSLPKSANISNASLKLQSIPADATAISFTPPPGKRWWKRPSPFVLEGEAPGSGSSAATAWTLIDEDD